MTIIVSHDAALLDIPLIHRFLCEESSWAQGIPYAVVEKSIRHSLCFGAYENDAQVGFARVVTDRACFAYLADVFTVTSHRGRGISRLLVEAVLTHPDLQHLRRFNLATSTASGIYAKYGWTPLSSPDIHMERYQPDAYARLDDKT
jgi:GNAT superfamily N-acetyltransferase